MRILLSLLSGIFLFFSFPKYGIGFIAWFAFIPLFLSLRTDDIYSGFKTGFLTGLIAHVGIFYWIAIVTFQYGHLPMYIGIIVMLLLAGYLSLYTASFAAITVYFRKRKIALFLAVPSLWVVIEYLKSHLFTGFPWANLAYSQYLQQRLIQISDITGIYGISFLIIMVNIFFYQWILNGIWNGIPKKQLIVLSILLLLAIGYGDYRIKTIRALLHDCETLDVALIQGNIKQDEKWNIEYQNKTVEIYRTLSEHVALPERGLIVWPETSVPFYYLEDTSPLKRTVSQIAKRSMSFLLFGSPSYMRDGSGSIYNKNSAYLLGPSGNILGRYDKVRLVPYGEYVPLKQLFPHIEKLVAGVGDFKQGEGYYTIPMNGKKLGVLICYEAIFSEGARIYKSQNAGMLINITNDAWFGDTSAPYQHLSMTLFRAIENRLFFIRSANSGISAIIDPTGNIISRTKLFERTTLQGRVKLVNKQTFYAAYSDVFVYVCGLILVLLIGLSHLKGRRI